jgi:Fe-Mn family superoxide dismutase
MRAKDLERHYTNHYLQSERRLRKLLYKNGLNPPLINIFRNSQNISSELLDSAGEFMNHRLFWKTIAKTYVNQIADHLKHDIEKTFGSVQKLESKFLTATTEYNDKNGWIWLTTSKGKMKIVKTNGNVNPLFSNLPKDQQGYPLFGLDMWQHAYINQYASTEQYCQAYFKAINWGYISKRHNLNNKL